MRPPGSVPELVVQVAVAVAITGWVWLRERLARRAAARAAERPEFTVVLLEAGEVW